MDEIVPHIHTTPHKTPAGCCAAGLLPPLSTPTLSDSHPLPLSPSALQLALQRQLAAVQLDSSPQRLSERLCISLVLRLLQQGRLELLFTHSGKEYVTPQHLRKEILDELHARGGQHPSPHAPHATSPASALPLHSPCPSPSPLLLFRRPRQRRRARAPALRRPVAHRRRHLPPHTPPLPSSPTPLYHVDDLLLTSAYLDATIASLLSSLTSLGSLSLSSTAQSLSLPTPFLRSHLTSRLPPTPHPSSSPSSLPSFHFSDDGDSLYTDAFLTHHLSLLRGALLACTRPTPLRSLLPLHPSLLPSLLHAHATTLLSPPHSLPATLSPPPPPSTRRTCTRACRRGPCGR